MTKGLFLRIPLLVGLLFVLSHMEAQDTKGLEGRWDLTIEKDGKSLPSWLEIKHSGRSTLVGRFVYAMGSARPISVVKVDDEGNFRFAIPPQWEEGAEDMIFTGRLDDDAKLSGSMIYTDGSVSTWTGKRAPILAHNDHPKWGQPIEVFNGKDLTGWHATKENQWIVKDGILTSPKPGANLVTDQKFTDFRLEAEFRYPENGNSGIYLRGRHEVQIADSKGMEASDIQFGAIYGFLTPNAMAAGEPGTWQRYEITLIGQRVTIIANGKAIITDQTIPGITGGALDSDEGAPGSLFIQGDHGPVEFRKFVVTPVVE